MQGNHRISFQQRSPAPIPAGLLRTEGAQAGGGEKDSTETVGSEGSDGRVDADSAAAVLFGGRLIGQSTPAGRLAHWSINSHSFLKFLGIQQQQIVI